MVLETKIRRRRQLNDEQTQVITQFNKRKGTINIKELKAILTAVSKKGKKKHDLFNITHIRILNGDKWQTFYDTDAIDEYYEGKVKDAQKFTQFFQFQLTMVYE